LLITSIKEYYSAHIAQESSGRHEVGTRHATRRCPIGEGTPAHSTHGLRRFLFEPFLHLDEFVVQSNPALVDGWKVAAGSDLVGELGLESRDANAGLATHNVDSVEATEALLGVALLELVLELLSVLGRTLWIVAMGSDQIYECSRTVGSEASNLLHPIIQVRKVYIVHVEDDQVHGVLGQEQL